jgi:arylsulfatase A-like enzyme
MMTQQHKDQTNTKQHGASSSMTTPRKPRSLLKMLVILTGFFILAQILLLVINASTFRVFDTAVSSSLTHQILHSHIFISGLLRFIASQLIIYTLFVGLIWYLAVSIGELFSLRATATYLFGVALLFVSAIFVLCANYYFVPHSFFSNFLRDALFTNPLADTPIRYALAVTGWFLLTVACLAASNLCFSISKNRNRLRHVTVFLIMAIIAMVNISSTPPLPHTSTATAEKPNIIIIGIDAVRPDFVGFNNKSVTNTPHIDAFLKSGINFSKAYTPLPRTFPSWTSILTGSYPKHTGARGNNTDLSEIALDTTLPKTLRQAGYETIYSTDDTRFNNTNQLFGFDQIVTPPMGLNDFLLGTANDLPLSNLLITTPMGRLLFPYNYANHGAAITYAPYNFLQLLDETLARRAQKPLFIAVHFTVTHWPFYWFNDKISLICSEMCRYQAGISEADKQVASFMETLKKNQLLDHAVVVLLSDHGTSMGLQGDRITAPERYQGDKTQTKKLTVMKYANAPANSLNFQHDYGIDTSYGYGGDVLSLKQYHALLAFKGYGVDIGKVHTASDRILLMDIAPTLLDLLNLPNLAHADGVSLKSYFSDATDTHHAQGERPLFWESSFTLEEIEKQGISVEKVLAKTVKLYRMDAQSGLVFIKKEAEKGMDKNKQEAIIQGDWLLAQLPESARVEMIHSGTVQGASLHTRIDPGYMVLVNLKTGDWTLELDNTFARTAPLKSLREQLYAFYGTEIAPPPAG